MIRHRPFAGTAALALMGALLMGFPTAKAQTSFYAILTHDQESVTGPLLTSTGDPRPQPFGTATFTLSADEKALSFQATIYNLDVTGSQTADPFDNLRAAHIHAPAPPGSDAGVRWGFFGMPFNDTSPTDTVAAPFAPVGGRFSGKWDPPEGNNTTLAEQLPNVKAGFAYINFHTNQFPGGEIRGQIVPGPAARFDFAVPGHPLSLLSLRQGDPPLLTFRLVGSNGYVRNGQTPIPTLQGVGTILSVQVTGDRVVVIAASGVYQSRDGFLYVRTGP